MSSNVYGPPFGFGPATCQSQMVKWSIAVGIHNPQLSLVLERSLGHRRVQAISFPLKSKVRQRQPSTERAAEASGKTGHPRPAHPGEVTLERVLWVWTREDCALVLIDAEGDVRGDPLGDGGDLVELHVHWQAKTANAFDMPIV